MPSRSADIKVIVSATIAVLLAGFFIAGAVLIATNSGSNSPQCGSLNVGAAADIRRKLVDGGPYLTTGGAKCSFWLALVDNDIVAYKAEQSDCALNLKRDHWDCGGRTVAESSLARYPVSIQTIDKIDALVVDLRTPATSTTATKS